jgi:tRNA (adenine57-N1/adenine58-N1)-methyltransferase
VIRQRRGPFAPGDQVQLTDPKGRQNLLILQPGKSFYTHRGSLAHDDLIGSPEGSVVRSSGGTLYVALRPLLADFTLAMTRGAAVIYPKDAAQIVAMADIFPGARVLEAGAGSGALSCWLLRAVGEEGLLVSYERRADFAGIARGNVERFFGGPHPAWRLRIGDLTGLAEAISPEAISPEAISPEAISPEAISPEAISPEVTSPGGPGGAGEGDPGPAVEHEEAEDNEPFDRVVLDMVAPWEHIGTAAGALIGGGVICCYVSTVTQLSRTVETVREQGSFDEPAAWESLNRGWHVDGLAVRPGHRMIAHTGFLVTARRLAEGMIPPPRRRRPAKGARDPEAGP